MSARNDDRPDELRRKLLKSSALLGGAFAAGHALPYVKPGSKGFEGIPSAYAMQTPSFIIGACTAEDTNEAPGVVGQTGIVSNITATVSPIPPLGTLVDCAVTSSDPLNPMGTGAQAVTDAAGVATFGNFNMSIDFPAPLVAVGSVVTFTHSFNDQATFGPSTCATNLAIVVPVPQGPGGKGGD